MKSRLTTEKQKRKYNASFRLRQKIGEQNFPLRSRKIKTIDDTQTKMIPEVKILLGEFGFILEKTLIDL